MPDYVITSEDNQQIFSDANNKGAAITYQFDFNPWSEDNNAITSVTWTIKSGQATITNEVLSSNVASSLITLNEIGGALIEVTADTGTQIYVTFLDILARDQQRIVRDYGLVSQI